MPLSTTSLITDIRTQMVAALPELSTHGVYEVEHIDMIPWTRIAVPVGIITASQFEAWADGALTNLTFQCQIDMWYVMEVTGASSGLRSKLETLIDKFWPLDPLPALGHGQCLDVLEMSYSEELTPNQRFVSANRSQRAGLVSLLCLIGAGN